MVRLITGLGVIVLCGLASATLADEAKLGVEEFSFCAGISELTPVSVADTFPSDIYSVYCFTRITGAADTTTIVHSWYHQDTRVARVELAVKSARWRTYSSKRMMPEWRGQWRVDVTTLDGSTVASKRFLLE